MSLISALYTGVSGIQSYGSSLQVVGDNIANVSTIGFKANRAEFAALLSQSTSGGNSRIGRGVALDRVTTSFAQGSFSNTDRLTDLGIDGNGFFIVNDGQRDFYTRNGQFSLDSNGFLVNSRGYKVQGNNFDIDGQSLGKGDIKISQVSSQPKATGDGSNGSGVQIYANLDAREAIPAAFDVNNAEATSSFSTTLTVYDSLGDSHSMTVYLRKSLEAATTTWEWFATVDGAEIAGAGTDGVPFIAAQGTLVFTDQGALQTQTTTSSDFDFVGAAANQIIGFDFGEAIDDGGSGLAGTTQFAAQSNVRSQSQDGFSSGSLSSVDIQSDGTIVGFFTNGQVQPIGQLLLADFASPQGLAPAGGGLFSDTLDSGQPVEGTPNSGGLGTVSTFTLELSNVDLASEFVNLVIMQRAFQANSRIISTVDQLLADVVNIIR